jgi:hypothetical protein
MSEIQAPPFCVQIEPTEGCPLMCSFCGIHGIRKKAGDYKFMTVEVARDIAISIKSLKWNSRIEFAMHGEPTMNPKLIDIIAVFRQHLPKNYLLLETNGRGIIEGNDPVGYVTQLKNAGLNCLAIDDYHGVSWASDVVNTLRSEGCTVLDYPANKAGNPHQRKKGFTIVRVAPITLSGEGTHATLNNHCGCGGPLDFSKNDKRCAKPFREMSIRWNGKVSICCNDWRGIVKAGDIKDGLEQVWNGEVFQSTRRILLEGRRDLIGICNGCNATSYRPGLLPDLLGQVELSGASQSDVSVLAKASAGPIMAPRNQRPWEV